MILSLGDVPNPGPFVTEQTQLLPSLPSPLLIAMAAVCVAGLTITVVMLLLWRFRPSKRTLFIAFGSLVVAVLAGGFAFSVLNSWHQQNDLIHKQIRGANASSAEDGLNEYSKTVEAWLSNNYGLSVSASAVRDLVSGDTVSVRSKKANLKIKLFLDVGKKLAVRTDDGQALDEH